MTAAYRIRVRRIGATLSLLLLPHAAIAGDFDDREKPRRAAEILESMDDQGDEPSWISHIQIKKKHGLQFKRRLGAGDERVIISVHGPILSRKRLGLGFELKF